MLNTASILEMIKIAWYVIAPLAIFSIISGAIILERWFTLSRADFDREGLMKRVRRGMAERKKEQVIAHCESINKPVGRVLANVLEMRPPNREILDRLSDRIIRAEVADMMRYITVLGTIGSIAPFVGLFGTVVGIIHAFQAIAQNAGGGPSLVSKGIAEALITTALGLFVAIPAVFAYNMFTRRIERIAEDMELCAEEVTDLATMPPPVAGGVQ
jgi:biopolymer transport protein ExbB/TolQ